MSNVSFSPRQLTQLDERFENCGFNARQLTQLDEILDKRGFNAIQLKQLDERFAQQDARWANTIVEETSRALGVVANGMVADNQRMLAAYLEDRDRRDRAVSGATETRLATLEEAELPGRVSKLEAAVFPSKPQRRRRG